MWSCRIQAYPRIDNYCVFKPHLRPVSWKDMRILFRDAKGFEYSMDRYMARTQQEYTALIKGDDCEDGKH